MSKPPTHKPISLIGPGSLTALALAYVLLIAYGSLFPLISWRAPEAGLWNFLFTETKGPLSLSDIDINILAYIPLGLLLALRLRQRTGLLVTLIGATLLGAGVSLSMEILQNYLPQRVPSRIDLATNTLGTLLGALCALLFESNLPLGRAIKLRRDALLLPGPLVDIGLAVLAAGLFTMLAPLAPSIEPALRASSIVPLWQIPFGSFHAEPIEVVKYAARVVALGLLFALMTPVGKIRLRYFIALLALIMAAKFVSTVLLFKIPPLQWQLSIKATLGLALGLTLLPLMWRLPRAAKGWASIGTILALTVFDALQPGASGEPPNGQFNWVPFAAQMFGIQGLLDVLASAMPFLVMGCALNLITPYLRRHLMLFGGLVAVFAVASGVEWLQRDLPGRTADITDILLAGLGWIGTWFWVARIPVQVTGAGLPRTAPQKNIPATAIHAPSKLILSVLLLTSMGALWGIYAVLDRPVELALGSKQAHQLPTPEELPAVDLPGFKLTHPRLPAPSAAELGILRRDNPGFFQQQRFHAQRGDLMPIIFLARAEPGSQDLRALHRRLMQLEFTFRGQDQAKPIAVAYDWLYDQWSEDERAALRDKLADGCRYIIQLIRNDRLSPYNVYLYNSPLQGLMAMTLALYRDDARGEPAMRFLHDMWKNRTLPVWRQIMGNNGGWHEGGEYIAIGIGQAVYQMPAMWRSATGEDLFKTEPGIRGFMDFILYRLRPDGTHYRIGDASFSERIAGDLLPLALEYRDAAAYSLRQGQGLPAPSAWPWGPLTDVTLFDHEAIKSHPKSKFMDGIGVVVSRSSWEPDATYVTFKAGDNFWSHSHLDQGSFTIFKGGPLAIDSGFYGPQYGADHHMNYTYQTIAHNTVTVTDPDDTVPLRTKKGEERSIANDGGQRRVGSGWGVEPAPMDLAEWTTKREIYHTGKIEQYLERDGLVAAVADLTPAYTNAFSGRGTFSHRTQRVERFRRTFIHDQINDIIVIYDQLKTTRANFRTRWLLHSLQEPLIANTGFTLRTPGDEKLSRREGRLQGSVLLPEQANITAIGGKGFEYFVDGKNYDENGKLNHAVQNKGDKDVGAWRIEVSPATEGTNHRFLIVLAPTLGSDAAPIRARLLREAGRIGCEITGPKRTVRWWFNEDGAPGAFIFQ